MKSNVHQYMCAVLKDDKSRVLSRGSILGGLGRILRLKSNAMLTNSGGSFEDQKKGTCAHVQKATKPGYSH